MKHIKLIYVGLLVITLSISCGGEQEQPKNKEDIKKETKITEIKVKELVGNAGKSWNINKEMMPHIMKMKQDVKSFGGRSVADFNALGESLKADNKELISSCTMTGTSHDELHKWLMPYMANVNALVEVKDKSEGKRLYLKIMDDMETFNRYFQ